jgi:probable HAF family extracellular repeat protein
MKSRTLMIIAAVTLFAGLGLSVRPAAQEEKLANPRQYTVTDLGTLMGGHNTVPQAINNRSQVVGLADTPDTDPNSGFPVVHAFLWDEGELHDLGTLGGRNSGASLAGINAEGQVVGFAENDTVDPNNPPFLELRAFRWDKGQMTDLGTLGGNNACTFTCAINGRDRVVGDSQTGQSDPFFGQQIHPSLWEKGVVTDLGTLGGLSGFAADINERGQVVGATQVGGTPVAPFPAPPFFAFLWQRGVMTNLGALGGVESIAYAINNRAQVVGEFTSVDPNGNGITHAFLWDDGEMRDLGTVSGDTDSQAFALNNEGQIVGSSGLGFLEVFNALHAFLWENGVISDLNALIPANPDVQLFQASGINARGQIVALAFQFSTGNVHGVLLTPDHGTDMNQGTASVAPAEISGRPRVILSQNARNLLRRAIPGSARFKARSNQK